MKLSEINEQILNELELQITQAEHQKIRLDNYIEGLRAYYHGTKTFLEMRNRLQGGGEPIDEIRNFLDASDSDEFQSITHNQPPEKNGEIQNQQTFDLNINPNSMIADTNLNDASQISSHSNGTNRMLEFDNNPSDQKDVKPEESVPEQEVQIKISDEEFQKMPQFEALKTVLKTSGKKLSIEHIKKEFFRRGFKPQAEFFDQSLGSMLRYHEKKGVFRRDNQNRWGLGNGEVSKRGKKKLSTNNELTNSDCSYEIIKSSGQPWLHVDQILVIMEQQYGYKRDKESVSSSLRKSAKRGDRFKFLRGNRFGLLENSNNGSN
jgi:hypothetical protein